jgi:hypothetical protein
MVNDYVVRWSAANHDNVANKLVRYAIKSFGIQNQASHLTSNPLTLELMKFLEPRTSDFIEPLHGN